MPSPGRDDSIYQPSKDDPAQTLRGLPIADLVSAPLVAACDAQIKLAKSIKDFITEVGFKRTRTSREGPGQTSMLDFQMTRPYTQADGRIGEEEITLRVPVLAIVPIPNLQVSDVSVDFEMTVQTQLSVRSDFGYTHSFDLDQRTGNEDQEEGTSSKVVIHGEVSAHHQQIRSTDISAKYSIHVAAKQQPAPEGLLKLLDVLNSACVPKPIARTPPPTAGSAAPAAPATPPARGISLGPQKEPA